MLSYCTRGCNRDNVSGTPWYVTDRSHLGGDFALHFGYFGMQFYTFPKLITFASECVPLNRQGGRKRSKFRQGQQSPPGSDRRLLPGATPGSGRYRLGPPPVDSRSWLNVQSGCHKPYSIMVSGTHVIRWIEN